MHAFQSDSTPRNVRFADDDLEKIAALSKHWGPVRPLSLADVVRVAIRRAHETELGQGASCCGPINC